ncbi:hypothetical protein Btru_016602 [Bulinus truncatus]|nr:hypothetical protein Btru_016602 [Bulinus truncatus]
MEGGHSTWKVATVHGRWPQYMEGSHSTWKVATVHERWQQYMELGHSTWKAATQLLCLLLQALASVALTPAYHSALSEADVADMLMQLLLPSDEWYYTNHSTKYAKYVKYHAARILVYMGLFHKLGGRVDIFDRRPFIENNQSSLLQVHSPEDSFIELMAMGKIVMLNSRGHIEAASMEGLIAEIIQEASNEERDSHTPFIRLSGSASSLTAHFDHELGLGPHSDSLLSPIGTPSCSLEFLRLMNQQTFREYFLASLPMVVHPVIVLRLLSHRLFGNMIRRKTLYSDAKLKPPKVDKVDSCPPRKLDIGEKDEQLVLKEQQLQNQESHQLKGSEHPGTAKQQKQDQTSTVVPKPKPSLRVMVSDSGIDEDEGHTGDLDDAQFNDKITGKLVSHSTYVQNKNGTTTKLALRAIGESLVTPLDLDIKSRNKDTSSSGVTTPPDLSEALTSDPASKQPSSKKLFRWPSKKRLSKSQVNVQLVHQDSIVSGGQLTSGSCSEASTPEVDIVAFQRELINLPTFVMETPQMDVSPVFSRSSSVPENLATRHRSNLINSSTGQLHVHTDVVECKLSPHSPSRPTFIFPSSPMSSTPFKAGSMVTITTTDVGGEDERIIHHPANSVESPVSPDQQHSSPPSSDTPVAGASITVHFEAPSSPNPSTSSQSPQAQFDFPSIPPSTSFANHLSVKPEYVPVATLCPIQQQVTTHTSLSTPVLYSPSADLRSAGTSSNVSTATSIATPSCEISFQHRGVLKVLETWCKISQIDLEGNSLIALETREFLKRLSAMGHDYKVWCHKFSANLRLEECITADQATEAKDDNISIHLQYKKNNITSEPLLGFMGLAGFGRGLKKCGSSMQWLPVLAPVLSDNMGVSIGTDWHLVGTEDRWRCLVRY